MGGFEVLAEELEGEAEEGLVLGKTVSWECERWGGGAKEGAYEDEVRIGV